MAKQIDTDVLEKKTETVCGRAMAYHESGEGMPIVFLHGNPTSSYLWRNVMPHVSGLGRCIAPELLGMGDSEPFNAADAAAYEFLGQQRALDEFLGRFELGSQVILVLHDWGSALGFDWANRHRDRVAGIAYMEAIVQPLKMESLDPGIQRAFSGFRSPAGERMILEENFFIERMLPSAIVRGLTSNEMDEYRRPYRRTEHRVPMLNWPRTLPIDGEPEDIAKIVRSYGEWLETCAVPKLFINAKPGAMLVGPQREYCRRWPNQTEVTVTGIHYLPEDSPHEIGAAIAHWLESHIL